MLFKDRSDAGAHLAGLLQRLDLHAPLVLALPRGGVPVAYEIARALDAPLDVLGVRKIGAPGRPELGIGAVAEGGEPLFDEEILRALRLTREHVADVVERERAELRRRVHRYRGDRPPLATAGRDAIVVDDGLATGVTARAALRAVRPSGPHRLLLAVPVAAEQTVHKLRGDADEIVAVRTSRAFGAVGQWYDEFSQVSDETVLDLLARAPGRGGDER